MVRASSQSSLITCRGAGVERMGQIIGYRQILGSQPEEFIREKVPYHVFHVICGTCHVEIILVKSPFDNKKFFAGKSATPITTLSVHLREVWSTGVAG